MIVIIILLVAVAMWMCLGLVGTRGVSNTPVVSTDPDLTPVHGRVDAVVLYTAEVEAAKHEFHALTMYFVNNYHSLSADEYTQLDTRICELRQQIMRATVAFGR